MIERAPYEKIIRAYDEILSKLYRSKELSRHLKRKLDIIWSENKGCNFKTEEEGIEYFRDMFRDIARNPFFFSGARSHLWPIDFEWIVENWIFLEEIFMSLSENGEIL